MYSPPFIMYRNITFILTFVSVIATLGSCEKDNDRCNCVDNNGEQSFVSVDDQECSDLSTSKVSCYPAD